MVKEKMASNAGHGKSSNLGEDQEGKATKNPIPPVRTLPPGGNPARYEIEDTISPPSIKEPWSVHSAKYLTKYEEYANGRYVRKTLHGATKKLTEHVQFFGSKPFANIENTFKMASPQLLFVDGSFPELAQEMADYIQVGDQVKPLLEREQNEEALQTIVKASQYLNSVPEKEFTGAYNLLIHLVLQSQDPKKYLPTVCGNLLKPITSSPNHGFTLAANALSTVFNLLDKTNPLRYNVFLQIVRFIRQHGQFDLLKPRLHNLEGWFQTWDTDEEDQRRLYVEVSEVAAEAGDDEYVHYRDNRELGPRSVD